MSEDISGKRAKVRDYLTIGAVIVLIVLGYSLFRHTTASSEGPHEHPQAGTPPAGMSAEMMDFPSDYNGLVTNGNKLMDAGRYAEAAESYRRALAIDGGSPDVRTDFGACLHAIGLDERALEEFRTVLDQHPDHLVSRFNVGIVFHGLNQPDSARAYWEELLRRDPDGPMSATVRELLATYDD